MTDKTEIQQTLLELHYGLLDETEAAHWRQRIETNPDVARVWKDVLSLAGQFAEVARLEGLPQESTEQSFRIEDVAQPTSHREGWSVQPAPPEDREERPRRRGLGLAVVVSAVMILAVPTVGFRFAHDMPEPLLVPIRLQAQAVAAGERTRPNQFRFMTARHDGPAQAVPASLTFAVRTPQATLLRHAIQTGADGSAEFVVPASLQLPRDARLQVTATSIDGSLAPSQTTLPLEPTRCLTYLTVDKPLYRPGETVYFRSLTLERYSLRAELDVPIRFELLDPSGAVVANAVYEGMTQRGVGNGAFALPVSAVGGQYTLVAKSLDEFFPEERRVFQVQQYRVPRFRKDLEFQRRSYGPGDLVEADFSATRAEGGPLSKAHVRATATVDGVEVETLETTTSELGTCVVSFRLPEHITDGDGQLAVSVDDGGTRETLVKTIPIQLGRVQVDFYPEGGYLVAGLENRVYFAARNTLGKPVHVTGQVLDQRGREVARAETVRDGMGSFRFEPTQGEQYVLKITKPLDVTNSPQLPAVMTGRPVLDTGGGVFAADGPLSLAVRSDEAMPVLIQAACRGASVGETKVRLRRGENSLSLPLSEGIGGVIRLTVLDARTTPPRPLVERLVFRRHDRQLRVQLLDSTTQRERSPGDPLRLTLQVVDEHEQPTPAVLGVAVVDDAVLSLDEHERPTLRTHFLLTSEVSEPEDLEHANFYLGDQPEAAESLDLLLGTQGWRRFVETNLAQPNPDFHAQIAKLLELDGRRGQPLQFDNSADIERRVTVHSNRMAAAWRQLLADCRVVAVPILLAWLISLLFRPRRYGAANAGLLLWFAASMSAWALVGCSGGDVGSTDAVDFMAPEAATEEPDSGPADETSPTSAVAATPSADEKSAGDAPDDSSEQSSTVTTPESKDTDDIRSDDDREVAAGKDLLSPRVLSQEDLQRLLQARGLDANALADKLIDDLRFPVREYAHKHVRRESGVREDFTETLFWHPLLITDAEGQATVRFDLSDSVTSFRVLVDAHAGNGRIGSGGGEVVSRLTFQLEPKLPLEVTTGDRIELPVAAINQTDALLPVQMRLSAGSVFDLEGERSRTLELAAGGRHREHFTLNVRHGSAETDAVLEIHGSAGTLSDAVRRRLHVAPSGYPVRQSLAGAIDGTERVTLTVPPDAVPGSLAVTLRAYPSPLADLLSGVESILREPHGCFEQTTATNYPNTMALQYLRQSQLANPEVTRRAQDFLDRGYQKLTSFECQKRGYEWFGKDPGHEALTAFGLMQFQDMAEIMPVNAEMVGRTREWLLSRRNGQGGFHRNPRHLHVWSVQQDVVDAYVLWALTEADGQASSGLGTELDHLTVVASVSRDPYQIALSAAALLNAGRTADGERLLQTLGQLQSADGSLTGNTTVTQSGGLSLQVETTALATLAWLKSRQFTEQASRAAKWIVTNRQGSGGFGSTQATVLALKAIVAYSKTAAVTRHGGQLLVRRGREELGQATVPAGAESGTTIELTGLGSGLKPGANDLHLQVRGVGRLPYAIDVLYHMPSPPSDPNCPVRLATRLGPAMAADDGGPTLQSGDTIRLETTLKNTGDRGLPMTVAILGLPAGLEPRAEELNELRDAGVFDYYELRPREVICYWRSLEPQATKKFAITLTAAIPGRYTGPASRTYLYYTAEQKHWTQPLRVKITP